MYLYQLLMLLFTQIESPLTSPGMWPWTLRCHFCQWCSSSCRCPHCACILIGDNHSLPNCSIFSFILCISFFGIPTDEASKTSCIDLLCIEQTPARSMDFRALELCTRSLLVLENIHRWCMQPSLLASCLHVSHTYVVEGHLILYEYSRNSEQLCIL